MKGFNNHIALFILAISVTLVVGAVYGYMRYALSGSVERAILSRDIVRVEEANKSNEKDIVSLYESTAENRKRLSTFFIPADHVVTFIETIEGLARMASSTVVLTSIDADRIAPSAGSYGLARARVDAQGSWTAVMRTLEIAESLPYIIHIDYVRLDVSVLEGDQSSKRLWHLSFNISAAIK